MKWRFLLFILLCTHFVYTQSNWIYIGNIGDDNDTIKRLPYEIGLNPQITTTFDFCPGIKIHLISGIFREGHLDSLRKVWAVEDSIFYVQEKIRCKREKDSLQSPKDYIDFWIEEPSGNILLGDYDHWGILRDKPEEIDIKNLENLVDSVDEILQMIELGDPSLPLTASDPITPNPEFALLIPQTLKGDGNTEDSLAIDSCKYEQFGRISTSPGFGSITPKRIIHKGGNNISQISLYPNPASSFVNIKVDFPVKVQLYDIHGELKLSQEIPVGITVLDIQHLTAGLYILCMEDKVLKLIVE